MKVRSDFVTNSSSSSFVIAHHKGMEFNDIKNILNKEIINDIVEYLLNGHEIKDDLGNKLEDESFLDSFIEKIAHQLYLGYGYQHNFVLDDWIVETYDIERNKLDEKDPILYYFLRSYLELDHAKIKISRE